MKIDTTRAFDIIAKGLVVFMGTSVLLLFTFVVADIPEFTNQLGHVVIAGLMSLAAFAVMVHFLRQQ